ncbi:MAG: HD domain-containing protein [Chitinivibrionales bacterium]|nr:HD domain-containing protein [Chitinivibrionales bacterium]MBD3355538.1 HD domain-containing protein [Chitinivibrionales bacterium]
MHQNANIRKRLLQDEEKLSPFARRSSESLGRCRPITRDPFRLEFARDETRIVHSPPFRRLKHKSQVFLSPDNDHICTRMEHVLHVSSIASVVGRCLGLNTDLINAIAKAHDLGHPPYGHVGERVLDGILEKMGVKNGFKHEMHGLRVVDKLTNYGDGLNLTYEVRDGIITHCGESFEQEVIPDRGRDLRELEEIIDRAYHPATLEGCLVRMVDRIAYLGRDLEDGLKAGLVRKSDVPAVIARELGIDNGKIVGRLVNDTIANSLDTDTIRLSDEVFELMNKLKEFNYARIYRHEEVERKARKAEHILKELFAECMTILERSERGRNTTYINDVLKDAPSISVLFDFIKNSNFTEETPAWRIITDYIAGMTDVFAQRTYLQLFLPTPVI